ncbi:MAG: D-2-hydroxyacid dehydrogenase [Alphaproteobacteria bacterium]|nr:D-2-hydroxyacid dehydrogenase [Alphaproteobacteria bacterium]
MRDIKVLNIQRMPPEETERVKAISPAIQFTEAAGWFDGEIRETWPPFTSNRYLAPDASGEGTKEERDALLADAEVVLGGWPFPLDLRARAPKLKWFHQRPAGASNLMLGDLWGSDVTVTTSRGFGNTLPIAEYTIAGILHFAKGLHRTAIDSEKAEFDYRAYKPTLIEGKTVCVIGAGGIGQDVGRLCAALGMRVIGTRRHPPAKGETLPEGFAEIRSPADLPAMLAESDFVAVCCQWTPETTNLINAKTLAVMKPGGVLVNVARGEIIDENALADALDSGHLRGAALDVYVGEFERTPPERLWQHPNILITPHTSGMTDINRHRAIEVLCENMERYLRDEPLRNVIDWEAGY